MQDLNGKTAVITGAASGIGRALALACRRAGLRVIATDVERGALDALARELATPGGLAAATEVLDVRDAAAVEALAARCFAGPGGVELLFNNAGVMMTRPLWEHSDVEWRWLIDVNLTGIMNGIRAFVPRMLARGVPAHVVNTGSMASFFAAPMLGAYSASKFAVRALTEALHHDLRQRQACVQVSLLAPGAVKTRIFDADRNSPSGTPPLAGASGAVRDSMRSGTQQTGMDADAVADLVLTAIRAERFWIFPHPEMLAPLPELGAAIVAGQTPEFGLAKSWKLEGE
ncbi:MAG: SDR family NAD(P)-dependent oxidoreductase [Gammaproteobacteria bacterium]|nr:SDR family NAD(P)-dependent oxidoreductase [Gammaproteobacteria bacterium]